MNKLAGLSAKVKLVIAVVIVVIVAIIAFFLKTTTATMTPQQALNIMVFESKGYVGTGTIQPSEKSSAKAKNHKAYQAIALYEAKQAKMDTDIVKRVFDKESNGETAFKTLQNKATYTTDIYGNIKNSKQADFQNHISSTKIDAEQSGTTTVRKNGAKQEVILEDMSSSPYFEKVSRKVAYSGLKAKQKIYVTSDDFAITFSENGNNLLQQYKIYYRTQEKGKYYYSLLYFSKEDLNKLLNSKKPKANDTISVDVRELAKRISGLDNQFNTDKYDYTSKQGTVSIKIQSDNEFMTTHTNII